MSMGKRKEYPDDDGRTIADMSDVQRQPLFIPKLPKRDANKATEKKEDLYLTKKEQASYIFGTLKSALLIGAVFAAAFALLIILMLVVWEL